MAWESSDRRSRLPSDWPKLVAQVKKRDGGRCTWLLPTSGARCPRLGTDVDHKVAGDNHDLRNLQLLCERHHEIKTGGEARRGWAAKRKKPRRPEEQHPGMRRA